MSKIIVALDGMTLARAINLTAELKDHIFGFKFEDFLYDGIRLPISDKLAFMADAKIHKAPHSAVNTFRRLQEKGAWVVTAQAAGGFQMLTEMRKAAQGSQIATIQALTTQPEAEIQAIYGKSRMDLVNYLTVVALEAGITHFVTAAQEMHLVKELAKNRAIEIKTILPGYRPAGLMKNDDQLFTADDQAAKLADYVVIGRPITEAPDPVAAVKQFNEAFAK